MPNNYNGDWTAAHFADPVPIIQDGEVWQYGDSGSGVFGMLKPIIDRIAYLRQYAGLLNASSQEWLGEQIFDGPGKNVVFGSPLNVVELNATTQVNGAMEISSSGSIQIDSAAHATFNGPSYYQGDSAARGNRLHSADDSNQTYDPSTFDVLRVPQLTGNRTYTLASPAGSVPQCSFKLYWYYAGNVNGASMHVGSSQAASTGHLHIVGATGALDVTLYKPGESPLTVNATGAPGFYMCEFVWNGTEWQCIAMQLP